MHHLERALLEHVDEGEFVAEQVLLLGEDRLVPNQSTLQLMLVILDNVRLDLAAVAGDISYLRLPSRWAR